MFFLPSKKCGKNRSFLVYFICDSGGISLLVLNTKKILALNSPDIYKTENFTDF